MKTAVVFGYGEMGIRGLKVLLDGGVDVRLVVTHKDAPGENIWFESLEKTAVEYGIDVITPESPKSPELLAALKKISPDLLFSFYYRFMLPKSILEIPRAAMNMHGSLLPKYRGRAPTNWMLVHGETQGGATLHMMTAKADAGGIVDQMAFPILTNDIAKDVFTKTLVSAELILKRSLAKILTGKVELQPNPIEEGSYFGRRTAADGELKSSMTTAQIHNLVRAVAPPFPGAFFSRSEGPAFYIYRTLLESTSHPAPSSLEIYEDKGSYYLQKEPSVRIKILDCGLAGPSVFSAQDFFKTKTMQIPWRCP